MTPHILEKDKEQKEEVTWRTYDVAEYDRLSASYEDPKTMKWKLLPKPGGQAVKPEDYYTLKACIKQVEEGDPPKEQPMWTENGAVDYNGRALFQEWNKLKGKTKDEAKQAFCYAYGKALSEQRRSIFASINQKSSSFTRNKPVLHIFASSVEHEKWVPVTFPTR